MEPWNVVVTCRRNGERDAARELLPFANFRSSGFRDVLLGQVDDRAWFLGALLAAQERSDRLWRHVRRVVPVDEVFRFTLPTFRERLGEVVDRLAPRVPAGAFYVRLERRGHKGEIPTPEVEREMDGRIIAAHEAAGLVSRVDFREFGAVVTVETFRDVGGAGVLLREEMERYPFIRVP